MLLKQLVWHQEKHMAFKLAQGQPANLHKLEKWSLNVFYCCCDLFFVISLVTEHHATTNY